MDEIINYPDAFNGDAMLYLKFAALRNKHSLLICVETGTYHGQTTKALAEIFGSVFTIEINQEYFSKSAQNLKGFQNITQLKGSSPEMIAGMDIEPGDTRFCFFLDAHWNAYNPLLDELKVIAEKKIQPVIVIHDFYVPGKSTVPAGPWGFDTYDGQDYNWEWIKPSIEAIYGVDGYKISYNDSYEANRGCIFIEKL